MKNKNMLQLIRTKLSVEEINSQLQEAFKFYSQELYLDAYYSFANLYYSLTDKESPLKTMIAQKCLETFNLSGIADNSYFGCSD
jgi:Ca2+-binding EF-hand superfamily protein